MFGKELNGIYRPNFDLYLFDNGRIQKELETKYRFANYFDIKNAN